MRRVLAPMVHPSRVTELPIIGADMKRPESSAKFSGRGDKLPTFYFLC